MSQPYFNPDLIESKHFYTRTKACTILDIDPDVFDKIILTNIQSYSKKQSSADIYTGIFTGAEIKAAINKYYLSYMTNQLKDDLSTNELTDLAFRAKYSVTPAKAQSALSEPDKLQEIFKNIPVENYYPVPKGERKNR